MKRRRFKIYLAVAAFCLAALGSYCVIQASGPDRELTFVREVPTSLPLETLNQSIWSVSNWPQWVTSVARAERVDIMGRTMPLRDQNLVKGALISLEVQPHKGERRGSFTLLFEITDYVPNQRVAMRLVEDNAGRILKLFSRLEWKIELLPGLLRGTETSATRHWRARLAASLAERILMNQLFYPDLMALGQFTQPLAPNPFPVYGQ